MYVSETINMYIFTCISRYMAMVATQNLPFCHDLHGWAEPTFLLWSTSYTHIVNIFVSYIYTVYIYSVYIYILYVIESSFSSYSRPLRSNGSEFDCMKFVVLSVIFGGPLSCGSRVRWWLMVSYFHLGRSKQVRALLGLWRQSFLLKDFWSL